MGDTTYIVTVSKTAKGKKKQTRQKFPTEKKARAFYEKERQALTQEGKWGDVSADSASYFCATNNIPGPDFIAASVEISTEVNIDYYIRRLFCAAIEGDPDKMCKTARTLYRRGYDKGWEEGHWES